MPNWPLLLGAALASSGACAGSFVCCIDANGRQVCGDILPSSCYGRAYREIGQGGQTTRVIEAPLTPEQRARRAEDERRRAAEEAAQREQRRKDEALLQTYSSLDDIELMRQRAVADVQKAIQAAEQKIAETHQMRRKFENEAEFYKKKVLPPDIAGGLRGADDEIAAEQNLIDAKRKELGIVQAKYDEDRRRFLDLQARQPVR